MYSAMYGGRSGRAKGKQAKSKKNKNKCSLCHTKGHNEEDCPNKAEAMRRLPIKNSGGAGSGISHKTSRKAAKAKEDDDEDETERTTVSLPEGFQTRKDVTDSNDPYLFFDAGCDVGATLDALAALKVKTKAASNTPRARYEAAIENSASNYGGCLCRQYLRPGRAWNPEAPRNVEMKEAEPRIYYVLGLGPRFFLDETIGNDNDFDSEDEDEDESDQDDANEDNGFAIEALTDALAMDDLVVGFCAKLDYSPDVLQLPGYDKKAQLRRLRATCTAALQENVPIQCRIAPGATVSTEEEEENEDDPYVMVVRDLAKVLLQMSPPEGNADQDPLKVHLVSWNGKCKHMLSLLQAFPDTLYIGMNASVGFTKSTLLHECAFDVPMNRLLLETDNVIPTVVATSLGRRMAFAHSGHIPYIAAHVAEMKKNMVDAVQVARVTSQNTVQLYGRGIAIRAAEATAQAEATLVEANRHREEEAAAAAAAAAAAEATSEMEENEDEKLDDENVGDEKTVDVFETPKERKKKKKKKRNGGDGDGQANGNDEQRPQQNGCFDDVEANFDDEILASMVEGTM